MQAYSKIESTEFPICPCPHRYMAFPIIHIPYQSGTFVTLDESDWHIISQTHSLHYGSIRDILYSIGLEKWTMTCIHDYGIIQSIFSALKILCAWPIILFTLKTTDLFTVSMPFPRGSGGNQSFCNVGDLGSIPGLGRFPRGGHGNPLQYCCLENSHGQRSLEGYSPWGRKESDTMEQLSIAQHMPFPECNIYCWNHITCSLFTLTFT